METNKAKRKAEEVRLLEEIASERFKGIIRQASAPSTPASVLTELARCEKAIIRQLVAENPNTPIEVLTDLATDPAPLVRIAVAENPNTPTA